MGERDEAAHRRIDNLEKCHRELRSTVDEIKSEVTNHIPTTLSNHGKILERLEAKANEEKAVEKFFAKWVRRISIALAILGSTVGLLWGIIRLVEYL